MPLSQIPQRLFRVPEHRRMERDRLAARQHDLVRRLALRGIVFAHDAFSGFHDSIFCSAS